MQKVLFIDHIFHQKTRSADFFVDILRAEFSVETYYLTPEDRPDTGVLHAAYSADIVVLWQMDFLAPAFLALGKPVIVIPMFDGSGGMPDLHWLFSSKARFFNFCMVLNERIRMVGCRTMRLRYFPEPVAEADLPRFNELRAFFWQRRPDHGVDFDLIHSLIGHELDSLHVHNVPDIPGTFTPNVTDNAGYAYSQSTWFKSKEEYTRCLSEANVFIAPRVAEGIGMALLEAMSQGKLVLAHDAPTNNEYISSWINGILFNKDLPPQPISIRSDAERMGRLAWRTVVDGRRQWLESHPAILDWVAGAEPGPLIEMDHESFFEDLWFAYYASLDSYVAFLTQHISKLSQLTDFSFDQILNFIGESGSSPISVDELERDCALDKFGILDLTRDDDRFIGSGWSNAEQNWRWAVGRKSHLFFAGLNATGDKVQCSFTASALPDLGKWVQCLIALNGKVVFNGRVTPGWSEYEFEFDAGDLVEENELILSFDKARSLPTDPRLLSVCFKKFEFKQR